MVVVKRISRRQLLVGAGRGVFGVAVFGTLVACTDGSSGTGPSGSAPSGSGSASAAASGTGGAAAPLVWRRAAIDFVSAYVLVRGREAAIVDTGTSGAEGTIGQTLKAAGLGWDAVRHVLLTHKHPDHVGSLPAVAAAASRATLYAGKDDVQEITAARTLTALADGQEVFGLRVVSTPGHTLGHVSVFDAATGTLVAGDALRTTSGLVGSDPQYTADATAAVASVKKLATLPVTVILPGHGDPLTSGAREALTALAATL